MWPSRLVHSSPAAGDVEDDCEGVFLPLQRMMVTGFSHFEKRDTI